MNHREFIVKLKDRPLTYYEPTIFLFVGFGANPKLCARKKPLCVSEHLCLETHKKSNGGYNFSLCAIPHIK